MGLCDSDKCLSKSIRSIVSRVKGGASNWIRRKEGFRKTWPLFPTLFSPVFLQEPCTDYRACSALSIRPHKEQDVAVNMVGVNAEPGGSGQGKGKDEEKSWRSLCKIPPPNISALESLDIYLSEVSQTGKDKYHMITLICAS